MTVTWTSDDPSAIGFLIETTEVDGRVVQFATVSADARSFTFFYPPATPVRVRALGEGGMSAPTEAVMTTIPRRRAAGH